MSSLESLKKTYGFDKSSYKYIPAGGEIFECIGQPIIFVRIYKDSNNDWQSTYEPAILEKIDDFDPLTMTWNAKYKLEHDETEKEVRIIPEGFSWGNPEETGEMLRFVPFPLHYQFQQDELFFGRLKELWDTRETLDLEFIKQISESKEQEAILKYTHNIGALVKISDTDDLLWIRLWKIGLTHKNGNVYYLSIGDDKNKWMVTIKKDETEYKLKDLGTFKLIDLQG